MPHIRKRDLIELWKASDAVEGAVSAIMESATTRPPGTEAQIAIIQDRNLALRVLLPERPVSGLKSKDLVPADSSRRTRKKKRAKAAR